MEELGVDLDHTTCIPGFNVTRLRSRNVCALQTANGFKVSAELVRGD